MIDTRTFFDYFSSNFSIDHRTVAVALLGNSDLGPGIAIAEQNRYHPLLQDRDFLQNFAIYSMTATVQGNSYRNEVLMLPVAKYPQYTALIIAFCTGNQTNEIHKHYFQLVLFLPSDVADDLPKLKYFRKELLQKVGDVRFDHTSTLSTLYQVKLNMLRYLSGQLK